MRECLQWIIGGLVFVGTLGATSLSAQSVDTGILGAVADSTGALIPGVTVTVTNSATGVVNSVVTGANGAFELRYLSPGEHAVEVTLQGFRAQRTTIQLRVAQMMRVDFTIQIGEVKETVNVVAAGQLLETQSAVVRDVLSEER